MESIYLLIDAVKQELSSLGLKQKTILSYQQRSFNQIIRKYELLDKSYYDLNIMLALIDEIESQFKEGKISKKTRNWRIRGIKIIIEFHDTGKFEWKIYTKGPTYTAPAVFKDIVDGFILTISSSSKGHISETQSIINRYCIFLDKYNIDNFSNVTPEFLRNFLKEMHNTRPQSMDKVVTALRQFLTYLRSIGLFENNYLLILSSPRCRDYHVKPAMESDDISRIIDQIDISIAPGKRDYAILLLGITSGLRSGDIAALKLKNIYWKDNEIRIVQGKNDHPLILPLQESAKNALADYILHERYESNDEHIFLRYLAPHNCFENGEAIECVFRKYLKKADIEHFVNDGKTFHGLRRTFGTQMVSNGIPVTTVSQVLGHQSIRPTRQYISINMNGLCKCALSLSSLEEEVKE